MSTVTEAFVDNNKEPSAELKAWCSSNGVKVSRLNKDTVRFSGQGPKLSDMMWKFEDDFDKTKTIHEASADPAKTAREKLLKLGKAKKGSFTKSVREELSLIDELLYIVEAKKKKEKEKKKKVDDEAAFGFGLEDKDNFDKAKKAVKESGIEYIDYIDEDVHFLYFESLEDLNRAVKLVDSVIDTTLENHWDYITESVELTEAHDDVLCKKVFDALNHASKDYPQLKKMTPSEAATDLCDYHRDFEGRYKDVLPHAKEWLDEQNKPIKEGYACTTHVDLDDWKHHAQQHGYSVVKKSPLPKDNLHQALDAHGNLMGQFGHDTGPTDLRPGFLEYEYKKGGKTLKKESLGEHARNYEEKHYVFDKDDKKKAGPFNSAEEADAYLEKLKKKHKNNGAEGFYVDTLREDEDIDVDAELALLERKWLKGAVNPEKKGMFDGWTVEDLEKKLSTLRKSGPHKKGSKENTEMHEVLFALRAKEDHGFSKK